MVDAWIAISRRRTPGGRGPAKDRRRTGRSGSPRRGEARWPNLAHAVAAAATRLFEAICAADYGHDWIMTGDWKHFPAKDTDYDVRDLARWTCSVCEKFKKNPITNVRLGKVFANPGGQPTVHYELRLKDGEILKGDLPFRWNSEKKAVDRLRRAELAPSEEAVK